MTYQDTLQALRAARAQRDGAQDDLYKLRVQQLKLLRQQRKTGDDLAGALGEIRQLLPGRRAAVDQRVKAVGALLDNLFLQLPPQRLIEEWSDHTPILLLPLRIEVRYKPAQGVDATGAAGGAQGFDLCVRVFPDEVAVATHEKLLTEAEEQRGVAYWKALREATGDEVRKDAWRTLADKIGANRAAWVALQTKPANWSTPPPASDDALQFPKLELTKPDRWTQAPHSRVMPDRFVLLGYRNGAVALTAVGKQINDMLVLGPAPLEDDGNPSFTRNPVDNRLQYGPEMAWLFDFDLAVDQGMGFRIRVTPGQTDFDQLLVLGLKLSADEGDAQALVEELIDNHHYSQKGFSLVRQGSPTNNSDNGDSRFDSTDFLHDVSYFVENGEPQFTFQADPAKATDGQRLADALGINYGPLQFVGNAGATDHAEAVAMNRAMYAGTLGYYLHSMLTEVLPQPVIDDLRDLFTANVTGRGPLPAIRVGNQPYGVLLTSAFPKWSYGQLPRPTFEEHARRILVHLTGEWRTLKPQLRHIGKSGNARENLMSVLGLQPTSADYYHRVGYSWDYVRNLEQFAFGTHNFSDAVGQIIEDLPGRQFLIDFGYNASSPDGSLKPYPLLLWLIYQHYHTPLDRQNLVDGLPFSEEKGIKPYDEGTGKNYIDWLLDHAGDAETLERQNFGAGVPRPNALLYMMLHYSLLHEAKAGIHRLLLRSDIVADELVRSRKFMNISSQLDVSHWEVFRAPANRVLANETSDRPLLEFVQLERFRTDGDVGLHLAETKEALQLLRGLPTARLERLLAEHIDTLNYRLDSWVTALFERRLRQQRVPIPRTDKKNEVTRPMGIHLGSYGYLENVRPALQRRTRIPDDRLPAELREGKENLYVQAGNGGYVHTPSLNHAAAAAVLRNGYLTHATPAEREKLSVNLSSERVRRAKDLIDGIRNGQSLEQLLGYAFERGMHDWTTRPDGPVILDQLKPVFRAAFPIRRTRLPRQGFANEPAETIEDFSVVNGLDLARRTGPFPDGVAGLPALSAAQVSALRTEKNNIENSLDALRDVLTAECAYQLALGNFDRAAAVMKAISGGQIPVEIEVINSSRGSELAFTNRVTLQFDPAVNANPWAPIAMTPRANAEPALNAWIGAMLGDPAGVQCTIDQIDAVGNVLAHGTVALADLGLQPIDVMYLIRKTAEASGPAEIERRVRHVFARAIPLDDSAIVKITFANAGDPAKRSFAEVLPLLDAMRNVVGKGRPLTAQDFVTPSKTVTQPPDNPGNVDHVELTARVAAIRGAFDPFFTALGTQAAKVSPDPDLLRAQLIAIANAGFAHAFPTSSFGSGDAEVAALLAGARSLLDRYGDLKTAHDADVARLAGMAPPQQVALLSGMAKRFFGDDFVLLPRFMLLNAADVTQADAARDQLLDYVRNTKQVPLPVDEWLHGAALVRPSLHTLQTVMMLGEAFNGAAPQCLPLQLPFRAGDTWLGMEFPGTMDLVHDTIAFVQCLPQGFQPAAAQAGLLIDEWMEMLPKQEEVTGIAFNFDQPNSAPPSALLLAVTPEITGKWTWDNLTATVLDTMERARLRAVEPDMIETLKGFATLIPSTIAEFSTGRSTVSLDYLLNIQFIADSIAVLAATGVKP